MSQRFAFFMLGAVLALVVLAQIGWGSTFDEPTFRSMLRVSGRLSFLLWLTTFITSPLLALWRSTIAKILMRNRRGIGLMFAGSHTVHATLLVMFALRVPEASFELFVLVGGGIGFAFIAAMAITSFEAPARALGTKNWRRLHSIGTWYISLIFALDFVLTPILKGRQFELAYYPFALMILAAYVMRVLALVRASSAEPVKA